LGDEGVYNTKAISKCFSVNPKEEVVDSKERIEAYELCDKERFLHG